MKSYLSFLWPFYVGQFFWNCLFYLPVWILFQQSRGLNLAEIGFVMTGTYVASVLLEYPTGVFADKYGRKKSIIVSVLLFALAILVEITAYSVVRFFVAALIIGSSWAFQSGAREALIYDSLKEKKLQKYNVKVLGQLDTVAAAGGILSALIGSLLFTTNATLPYWFTLAAFFITLIIFSKLKEPKYSKRHGMELQAFFKEGLRNVWRNPVLKSLLFLYVPLFFFEEAWHNAAQPILVSVGLPVALLGFYYTLQRLIFGIGGIALPKLLGKFSHKELLASIVVVQAVVWIALGTRNLYGMFASSFLLLLSHQFWNYVDADIIHKHIPSHVRATTLSARQMAISIIWIFNPWFMGYLVNSFDRTYLFPVFGGTVLLIAGLVFIWKRKYF